MTYISYQLGTFEKDFKQRTCLCLHRIKQYKKIYDGCLVFQIIFIPSANCSSGEQSLPSLAACLWLPQGHLTQATRKSNVKFALGNKKHIKEEKLKYQFY